MPIGIRLNSTSRGNQGELCSKHDHHAINNDPSTSIIYPHDKQHCRNTQRVVSCGTKRVCRRELEEVVCAKQSPLRSGPMTEYVIVIEFDPRELTL